MQEIQAALSITIKENGEVLKEIKQGTSIPVNTPNSESDAVAGCPTYPNNIPNITQDEAERYAIVSDLANVCEYLEKSEVIKIRLIVSKAEARKEREEYGNS